MEDKITYNLESEAKKNYEKPKNRYWLHILLFILTFITCCIAGTAWAYKSPFEIMNWHYGLTYAILIITFLSAHEFGHYFAARLHKVDATLPFYIPNPFPELLFGTFGAVIKTRTPFYSRKVLFDIGAAGPIAGFIFALSFFIIGLLILPPKSHIYSIHPEYLLTGGAIPTHGLYFGDTLLFSLLTAIFVNPNGWMPPMNEIYHYPFLCVGWFGMFVTSLNMLPIGQLDGGHIIYAMFGNKHKIISRTIWWILLIVGIGAIFQTGIELLSDFDSPNSFYITLQNLLLPFLTNLKNVVPWFFNGWGGWLFWAIMTRFLIKLDHPEIYDDESLDSRRRLLGWLTIIIFILTFSFQGLYLR